MVLGSIPGSRPLPRGQKVCARAGTTAVKFQKKFKILILRTVCFSRSWAQRICAVQINVFTATVALRSAQKTKEEVASNRKVFVSSSSSN